MHSATFHRIARLCGKPLGGWTIHHWRVSVAIFAVSSALLLNTNAVFAQNLDPVRIPAEAASPELTPGEGDTRVGSSSDLIHVIAVGDTLSNVAEQYNVEVADLAAYNQILDYNHVVIGQKLRIPPAGVTITEPAEYVLPGANGYHVMRQGDSLGAVAQLYNLTLEQLLALNHLDLDDPNIVQMGTMLRLTDAVELPTNTIVPESDTVTYTVQRGDSLSDIAAAYHTTVAQILADNELTDGDVRVGQTLNIFKPATALEAFGVDAPADGERVIVVDLSDQSLTAYQGDVVVLYSIVSTGKDATPTRVGEFAVYQKFKSQEMTGEDYDLPGVPWVMYYDEDFAIHGAYWHANFGIPTSHGCTNMTIPESKALYSWAPIGTRVIVQQ
jgi:LysM repeat protein